MGVGGTICGMISRLFWRRQAPQQKYKQKGIEQ
jgi:hypothetical protein